MNYLKEREAMLTLKCLSQGLSRIWQETSNQFKTNIKAGK
jgi:hypothetical protein